MQTKVYPDYATFLAREDKTLNGVTAQFADDNPCWEEERNSKGCWNCSGCFDCSGCSRCSGCFDCSGCSRCSDCFDCSRCSDCSGCFDCSRCSDCSDCSDMVPTKAGKANPISSIPVIPLIHQEVLRHASAPDALNMGDWHTCDTTHCRAGWVVHLAGEAGKSLESYTSTLFAAMAIYKASSPIRVSPTRFYETNEVALADMKRCAEEESAASKL